MIWLPRQRLLLCGDTMEGTVTYADQPNRFEVHLANLSKLRQVDPERILPNHGAPDRIAAGGYPPELIEATSEYISRLRRCRDDSELRDLPSVS